MKSRIHNILLLVVALFTICSCSKPSKETFVSTLTIATMEGAPMDGASIVLSSEGEQYSFVIKSNTEWIIGCNAEWVKLSTATGRGNSEVTLSADATMMSRSAVVIIYTLSGQQIRASFNVVQHANAEQEPEERPSQDTEDDPEDQPEDNPEDNPEDDPENQPEDNPEDQPEDDPNQQPEDNPEDQPEGNPEQQPEDNPEQQPEEDPENQPEDDPNQQPEDNPEDQPEDNPEDNPEDDPENQPEDDPDQQPEDNPEQQPEDNPKQQPEDNPEQQPEESPENKPGNNTESGTPNNSYTKIVDASFLQTGTYFIGGYQNGTLHLATEGVSIENPSTERKGHVHTTPYIYNDSDGTLSAVGHEQAIEVRLEAASGQNAYYLYFIGEGYLMATENNTGCLTFTDEARYAWHFSNADEGFEVRQQGDIDARLIISRRASDRLIRSMAGDEDDGNPIVLFRKN
ncbi:MAG: hypothetical protein IIV49_02425 [Alistipes sp.]|nr:hypothetical protein [Alistipes sp.]MBQ6581010.1 hypothetical protein [Alistipes sp.]